MTKILWLSRHPPLPSQLEELERLYPGSEIIQDEKPFSGAEEIVQRFKAGGYNDIVVVAPLSVLGRLCDLDLKPLWAEMEQTTDPEKVEVFAAGKCYRFIRFRRVKRLVLEFEDEWSNFPFFPS